VDDGSGYEDGHQLKTDSEDERPVARQAPSRPKKPFATPLLDQVDRKINREASDEDIKPIIREEEDVKPLIKREEEDVKPVIMPVRLISRIPRSPTHFFTFLDAHSA
jgi:hypothetical protein